MSNLEYGFYPNYRHHIKSTKPKGRAISEFSARSIYRTLRITRWYNFTQTHFSKFQWSRTSSKTSFKPWSAINASPSRYMIWLAFGARSRQISNASFIVSRKDDPSKLCDTLLCESVMKGWILRSIIGFGSTPWSNTTRVTMRDGLRSLIFARTDAIVRREYSRESATMLIQRDDQFEGTLLELYLLRRSGSARLARSTSSDVRASYRCPPRSPS